MKKRRQLLHWLLLVGALVLAIGLLMGCNSPERRVRRYFLRNRDTLAEATARWQQTGELFFDPNLTANVWPGEHLIVEYIVDGHGIAPAGSYSGFFYSPDDVPVPFQNTELPLTPEGKDQWSWREQNGDNRGMVKKLEPCWYYFEAAF